jgi:PAS domain S-box-containing protein
MQAVALNTAGFSYLARVSVLAFAYFAAAKASLVFAIPPGYATAVWPPSGIALAVLLLRGVRWWPGVWLGAALTNYTVDLSIPAALGIATGNTLEALCAAWLASRFLDRDAMFRQPEAVFLFAACAALASVVAASAGVAVLFASGAVPAEQLLANWYTWWQGDTTGILVVAPWLLAWARRGAPAEAEAARGEVALFSGLFAATLLAVFAQGPAGEAARPLEFLAIPFFAWAACRFNDRVVTLSVLLASGFAIWCTVRGLGPFARASVNESLLLLQAFVATGALVAMVLCALVRRRSQALRVLGSAQRALEQTVCAKSAELRERNDQMAGAQALAHVGSWTWDADSGRLAWSDELCRIFGIGCGEFEGSFECYLRRVDARDRERVRALVRGAFFDHRSWDTVERIVRPDGSIRVLSSAGRAIADASGEPARIFGVCVDVTERVRLQNAQDAQYDVALTLARAPTEAEAIAATLRAVCKRLDWEIGQYWRLDAAQGAMHYACIWPAEAPRLDGFTSLAAQACQDGRPAWCEDFPRYAGDSHAALAGLHTAFAFPIVAGGKALGAMEFFAREPRQAEGATLDMAVSVGALLGEFIARARVEQHLRGIAAPQL